MKKSSLMGASVVAAALLAAAPVVAPVASLATPGTQVVKADSANPIALGAVTDLSKAATGYVVKRGESTAAWLTAANIRGALTAGQSTTSPVGQNNVLSATAPVFNNDDGTVQTNGSVQFGGDLFSYFFGKKAAVTLSNRNDASNLGYTVSMHFKGNDGSESDVSANNADAIVNAMNTRGGTLTMSLKFYYGDEKSTPLTNNDVDVTSSIVDNTHVNNGAAFINYKNNLTAQMGDNVNAFLMPSSLTNNGDMVNAAGNGILKKAFDQNAVTMGDVTDSYNARSNAGALAGNTFARKGTFYQRVIINLDNLDLGVDAVHLPQALENGLITINGSSTVSTQNPTADAYYYSNPQGHFLVLKRTINVTDANSPYKSEKVHGVVTVHKNDGMAAQVYDEKGNAVYERLLPNGSDWRTDEKRTFYKDGKEYYQVSTSEYVRAEDVSYAPRNDNDTPSNNSNSVIKGNVVVTKFPQNVVKLDSACWVWAIDDDNAGMHVVFDRVLPENSVWQCSAKATVNNKTFYQVSSNEWISASYSRLTK